MHKLTTFWELNHISNNCQYLSFIKLKTHIFQITIVSLDNFSLEKFKFEGFMTIFEHFLVAVNMIILSEN